MPASKIATEVVAAIVSSLTNIPDLEADFRLPLAVIVIVAEQPRAAIPIVRAVLADLAAGHADAAEALFGSGAGGYARTARAGLAGAAIPSSATLICACACEFPIRATNGRVVAG